MDFFLEKFDIAVVGAGHAGIEAALAAARMGMKTLCLCTCLDGVGNMACNPSIGGTAKGQLVREIDALGGEMAKAADHACIQYRMLNRGKGPAVFSPRSQSDRMRYRSYMKQTLERTENLALVQGEAAEILTEKGAVTGLRLTSGGVYQVGAVILCTGTYLKGRTFTGEVIRDMGPDGMAPANALTDSLTALGLSIRRFKTGTPSRVDGKTINFDVLELQPGEREPVGFSFREPVEPRSVCPCYITYTTAETHAVIRENLHRSPLYSGVIQGVGPRYCPSIEDKVVRFPDKERHQLFLEPCGEGSGEWYLSGFSSSLPEEVQIRMLHTLPGLEQARVMRIGYAIEYDCLDPQELTPALMCKNIPGLFAAGQICGSSGYEEAAAQGLIAGINAVRYLRGEAPFLLRRDEGYIGTLIDDLVTKGTNEPYRMMTSRSEYRLICRQDNADLRLLRHGVALGLVGEDKLRELEQLEAEIDRETARLRAAGLAPGEKLNAFLEQRGTGRVTDGTTLLELLKRPEISWQDLAELDPNRPEVSFRAAQQVEINVKYQGYIARQLKALEEEKKMEDRRLPTDIDYTECNQIRLEARQKLQKIKPLTLGQAARISGVSPSDVAALMVWLSRKEGEKR